MINTNKILNAMEFMAEEMLQKSLCDLKQGVMVVQIQNTQNPEQWESSIRFWGNHFRKSKTKDGREIDFGCNFDATVHGKIAYTRRKMQNSGASIYDLCGDESYYKGAVLSNDKTCICAFSGLSEEQDLIISQTGLEEYQKQCE